MKTKIQGALVFSIAALFLAFLLVAGGCGGEKGLTIKSGVLMMGSDTTYPPFENMEGGKAVGFDVDLATEIAKRMGLKLEVVPTAWDGIIPGLKTGKFDILMSAMTITPERAKEINFSDPYIDSDQSICVKKGSPIKDEDDLKGKVVGVQIDTTGQFTAEKMEGLKEISKFDTILLAFEALEQGKIDAIINDYPVNAYMSKIRGKTEVVKEIKTDEKYGIGVKKGNEKLLQEINEALREIKADGTYDKIFQKWFGQPS